MEDFIPVAAPTLSGNEKRYVNECLDTTWISSIGVFIGRFEEAFATYCGTGHAVSCNNGTSALHLTLLGLGIGPGDEVLVPTLTYIATANAVRYCGAEPVFVDSDLATWNLDPADLAAKLTPRSKAVIPVHLYGRPADMEAIRAVCRPAGIPIVEDAAEAVGARYRGRPVGGLGDVAAWSFFGNKIVTCGEGGMVTTDHPDLARRIRQFKGQGQDFERRYFFPVVGYNYRMTNIQAALGLAQLEQIETYLRERDAIAAWYSEELAGHPGLQLPAPDEPGDRSVCWLYSLVLARHAGERRDAVMAHMRAAGVETRPFFYPSHTMPPYVAADDPACPRAEWLAARGISLPTWIGMTRDHVRRVAAALSAALDAVPCES